MGGCVNAHMYYVLMTKFPVLREEFTEVCARPILCVGSRLMPAFHGADWELRC